MILLVVAVLLQALGAVPAPASAERPVRVWLGTSGAIAPGDPVRVYVATSADGYLLVLRTATDGRVDVLFPGDPSGDPYVTPGTYELRQVGDRPGFVAAEPAGVGLVLAALSPTPFRFTEFVRDGAWDRGALVASWTGADPEGALTDIVQRTLGDGYFNYDLVSYSVAPRPVALESAPAAPGALGPCIGCSFVSVTVVEPVALLCDPFFDACATFVPFVRRHRVAPETGICGIRSPCPEGVQTHAMALSVAPASQARVAPRSAQPLRFVTPQRPATPPPVLPRPRLPGAGAGTAAASRPPRITPLPTIRRAPAAAARPVVGAARVSVATRARLAHPWIPRLAPASEAPRAEPLALSATQLAPTPAANAVAAPTPRTAENPVNGVLRRSPTSVPALVPATASALGGPARMGMTPSPPPERSSFPTSAATSNAPQTIALPHATVTGVTVGVARSHARPR